ncbi:MAG TPA: T9SS type A sorting domain-containing protein, partial [Bacteroidetes bacterium]|nr:T9SS type A sorting domain-containing protein [Bacteroidota bacterium]
PEIIAVYPNPFEATINVDVLLPQAAELGIEVVNLMGQKMGFLQKFNLSAGQHTLSLDLSKLAAGTYIGKMTVNGIIANTVKFVKAQ